MTRAYSVLKIKAVNEGARTVKGKTLGHAKVDVTLSVYAHALSHKSASQPQMQALADRLLKSAIAA